MMASKSLIDFQKNYEALGAPYTLFEVTKRWKERGQLMFHNFSENLSRIYLPSYH